MKRAAVWALMLVAAGSTMSRADVISVNFSSGATYDLAPGTAAGVVSATNWNNFNSSTSTLNNLQNKFGIATTASASFSYSGTGAPVDYPSASIYGSTGNSTLYKSGLRATATGSTVTVSITSIPYAIYDVYVYASQNSINTTPVLNVTDGTTTYYYKSAGSLQDGNFGLTRVTSTNQSSPSSGNANYEIFSGKTGSSFSFTVGGSVTGTISNNLYGFQIVNAAVPEPGTLLLGGIAAASGGAGVWWRRRKRQPVQAEAGPVVGA